MKKKYAMIPINYKYEDDGIHIRRVLIRYLFKTKRKNIITYHGTKFIVADYYFLNDKSTHKYIFKDNYYQLLSVNDSISDLYMFKQQIHSKRKYHSSAYSEYNIYAIEFKENNIEDAINQFKLRKELR